jgi:hypothetical protein
MYKKKHTFEAQTTRLNASFGLFCRPGAVGDGCCRLVVVVVVVVWNRLVVVVVVWEPVLLLLLVWDRLPMVVVGGNLEREKKNQSNTRTIIHTCVRLGIYTQKKKHT